MNLKHINWKQPKYMLPAILYPLLLGCGYFIIDIFDTELAEVPTTMQTTEYLNPDLPQAQIKNDGIGGKYDNMQKTFGRIQDFSAVGNIDRDGDERQTEDYDSKYTQEDIALLDADASQRAAEMENASSLQERLRQSAEKGKEMTNDSIGLNLSDAERLARNREREQEAMDELNKALAEARLAGQKGLTNVSETTAVPTTVSGKIEVNEMAVSALDDDAKTQAVVKKVKPTSDYFNTLTENEKEPHLVKAIVDENIKAIDGSRVRLRLLDDVEINETVVKKGSYIYAIMSGFGSQRVKGNVNSLMVDDELVKVSLSIYDTDGLEGLYVPSSSFRETTKDVASSAMNGTMSMNNGNTDNSFSQWGMQAVQNAYTRTTNAISKNIKKNSVKLKYGSFVYLVNGREKEINDNQIKQQNQENMNMQKMFATIAVFVASINGAFAQQTYQEIERLTVNEFVTTVITATEPIRFVDISTDKVAGDQPINNIIRLKPKEGAHEDGEILAIVTIVTERYRTQYALLYTTRLQEAVTDKTILQDEMTAYHNPAVSLSTEDMYRIARNIWSSPAKWHDVKSKKNRMEMRLNNIYAVGDYFFIDYSVDNKTNIRFDIDEIRLKLADKKISKATNNQVVELTPEMQLEESKSFKYGYRNILVVKKMTFPNDKILTIEMSEKQISGRTISLNIDYEDVLSADSFNRVLLEEE